VASAPRALPVRGGPRVRDRRQRQASDGASRAGCIRFRGSRCSAAQPPNPERRLWSGRRMRRYAGQTILPPDRDRPTPSFRGERGATKRGNRKYPGRRRSPLERFARRGASPAFQETTSASEACTDRSVHELVHRFIRIDARGQSVLESYWANCAGIRVPRPVGDSKFPSPPYGLEALGPRLRLQGRWRL